MIRRVVSKGICQFIFSRPKVNAHSPALLKELNNNILSCEQNAEVRGVLLTSDQNAFSAGLDLKEVAQLVKSGEHGTTQLVDLIDNAYTAAMRISKPVACAVAGHAIAGGFVLAAGCDFIALQKLKPAQKPYSVGLTEVNVGVAFPRSAFEVCRHSLGIGRGLRELVFQGKLLSPERAFELGFGDVFVDDAEAAARQWLEHVMTISPPVFTLTKRQIHADFFRAIREPDLNLSLENSMTEQRREHVKTFKHSITKIEAMLATLDKKTPSKL